MQGTVYKLSDYPEPHVKVWDENWGVMELFSQYSRQWRTAMGGATGLDFNVFHHALDRKGVTGEDYDEWVYKLTVIESEALKQMHKK